MKHKIWLRSLFLAIYSPCPSPTFPFKNRPKDFSQFRPRKKLFPVATQALFLIISKLFKDLTLNCHQSFSASQKRCLLYIKWFKNSALLTYFVTKKIFQEQNHQHFFFEYISDKKREKKQSFFVLALLSLEQRISLTYYIINVSALNRHVFMTNAVRWLKNVTVNNRYLSQKLHLKHYQSLPFVLPKLICFVFFSIHSVAL